VKHKTLTFVFVTLFLLIMVSGLDSLGTFQKDTTVRITQLCTNATYINLTSVSYPNSTTALTNVEMSSTGNGEFYYDFSQTSLLGRYDVRGISDGCEGSFATYFIISSTGNFQGSLFYIILLTVLALFFLGTTLFVDEEFFVYISGILFLIGGIFIMINGLDVMNNDSTRYLAFIYLGIGLLFTLGAYVYNSYSKFGEQEEY
jgi:hypothetical protein